MYNELMTEKRIEITYDQDTKWFWRFCRSKLPARDDPNAPPRKNKRKPRYGDGDKKTTTPPVNMGDVPPPPVLKRSNGYTETSQRRVSNQPAWMATAADGSRPTQEISVVDFIPEGGRAASSVSDDGEFADYDIPNVSEIVQEQDDEFGGKRLVKEEEGEVEVTDDGSTSSCGV